MKRYMMTLFAIFTWMGMNAMDYETARERAYYLTDKMAYELNLNDQQYNDAYEINLDYLLSLNTEADLADTRYLAYRNDDLRHILYDWQWTAFAAVDYLFRPVWWLSGGWYFPVYRHYTHDYYFYHRPTIFWDYRGGHGRYYYGSGFYYNRRPAWHGGLRGMHHHMIGHPNGARGGRYGGPEPHHRDHRGGLDRRGGNGYHFDRGGHHPGNGSGNRPGGNGNGFNPGNNSHHNGGGNNNGHHNGGNDRPNMGGGHTGGNTPNVGSHNNGRGNMGGTRGNAFSGSSRGSHSISGSTRGGATGGSRSGGSHSSSRGGGRR